MKTVFNKKEVAFKENTIAIEKLPFPIVLYPGHYGTFFAFKKDEQSEPLFCSCAYEAIENYIKLRLLSPIPKNVYPDRMFILDSFSFPKSIVESLMTKKLTHENVFSSIIFSERICHECNLQTPSYKYCHEMYGGAFKQNYGWYINKQAFEWGIAHLNKFSQFLPESSSDELLALIKDPKFKEIKTELQDVNKKLSELSKGYYAEEFNNFSQREKESCRKRWLFLKRKQDELGKIFNKYYRNIWNIIENEVRRKFGHKKVGESWTSETILYYIVRKLFSQYTIHRHYRPDFLQGLELDIFIEDVKIGIEYQGVQHCKPVKYWGGKEALEKVRERDKKKKKICAAVKIPIVYFNYSEGLNDDLVLAKLKPLIK